MTRVGRLGRPNGLEGFLGLYVEDEDLGHFQPGAAVAVGGRDLTVRAIRRGNKGHEVAFEGVIDRSGAESLRGADVLVPERRQLAGDEFWPSDLVGLTVRPGGGEVVGVEHGPAQDRLVIQRGELRFEIPFVRDLVPVVDIEGGFVEIVEIEGLNPQ
ncbi:MAG: ribosome maturation factor RimM [Acidimicrobiia bacterium]